MYKFISWLVIAFIGLVPLGAFFDTKQSPKPNMEHSFMKREKRTVNSNTCDNVCEVQFSFNFVENSWWGKKPLLNIGICKNTILLKT